MGVDVMRQMVLIIATIAAIALAYWWVGDSDTMANKRHDEAQITRLKYDAVIMADNGYELEALNDRKS